MKFKLLAIVLAFVSLFSFVGCVCCSGPIDIDSLEGASIAEVIDGNTVQLDNGLSVRINGLNNTTFTQEHLQHYVGEEVTLQVDSQAPTATALSYDDTVEAYINILRTGEDLGYELLRMAGERAWNPLNCHDRYEEYEKVAKPHREILTTELLCSRMTAASMLVAASQGQNGWIGTAFFIGSDGLALTNNHVLSNQSNAVVYISDSHGNIDFQQAYRIKRIVYTDPDVDYTIFYVDIDPTTQKRLVYLPLAKDERSYVRGAQIASIGNPAPGESILTMSFATGTISAIRTEMGRIQQDVAITHGFSGGPTANTYGEVIGITVSGYENNNANLNFSVDARIVRHKLDELNLPYAGK